MGRNLLIRLIIVFTSALASVVITKIVANYVIFIPRHPITYIIVGGIISWVGITLFDNYKKKRKRGLKEDIDLLEMANKDTNIDKDIEELEEKIKREEEALNNKENKNEEDKDE